jgi:hypothetical protein
MNTSDTFFTSSIEAPKLQRPPETIVPSTGKTIAERTAQINMKEMFLLANFKDQQ